MSGCNECKPVLYYDEMSPQARSCLIVLALLRADIHLCRIDLFKGDHLTDQYAKINPIRTVPVLSLGNIVLTDAHAILMYLCENFGGEIGEQLFPPSTLERYEVINKLFFESSVLFRRHSEFLTDIVRKTYAGTDVDYHERKILSAYDTLEQFLNKHFFVAGDTVTIADISCVTTVGALNLMFPIEDKKDRWPKFSNWFNFLSSIPQYQQNLSGIEKQGAVLQAMGRFNLQEFMGKTKSMANVQYTKTEGDIDQQSVGEPKGNPSVSADTKSYQLNMDTQSEKPKEDAM